MDITLHQHRDLLGFQFSLRSFFLLQKSKCGEERVGIYVNSNVVKRTFSEWALCRADDLNSFQNTTITSTISPSSSRFRHI